MATKKVPVKKPVVKPTVKSEDKIPATPAEPKVKPAPKLVDPKVTAKPVPKKSTAPKAPPKSSAKQGVGAGVPRRAPALPKVTPPLHREQASAPIKDILDQASSASVKVVKKIDTLDIAQPAPVFDAPKEALQPRRTEDKPKPAKLDFTEAMNSWHRKNEPDRRR